jgi:hypothetical protein
MPNNSYEDRDLKTVNYDLHGLVGIRLLEATPADAAVVRRQVGPIEGKLDREPDITIRFVDTLSTTSRVRYLGVDDVAYSEDAFLVLRSKHKSRAKVQIPFEQVGQRCEIVCERGLPAVPLLMPILNLTALNNGALPIHASAFIYDSKGILVTGWAKGGKTETLLAFMAKGAEYVGDEWIYVSGDGQRMFGIPEPIRLWNWQLDDMPQFRARVARGDRARLRGLNFIVKSMEWVSSRGSRRGSALTRLTRRLSPPLKRQLYVQMPPAKLFRQEVNSLGARLDKVFFVASHDSSQIVLEPIEPEEISRRMVFSLQEERVDFLSYYLRFRFAFPGLRNELIERAEECQREALIRVLAGKDAYSVYHPYPVSIQALFETISPVL